MSARKLARLLAFLLTVVAAVSADEDLSEPPPDVNDDCPALPTEATDVPYHILARFGTTASEGIVAAPLDLRGDLESAAVVPLLREGEIFDNESALLDALGQATLDLADEGTEEDDGSMGVDWTTSRVVVFQEYASYRFGRLDGRTVLSGVYRFGDSLVFRSTYTNYGPCQGIAQDPSWFSYSSSFLLVVVPREPDRVTFSLCIIGGCPPDIP